MSEKIEVAAHQEYESVPVTVSTTQRNLGATAFESFQIPIMAEAGEHGELVLNNVATGEEVFRSDQEEAVDSQINQAEEKDFTLAA